ncbi:MAG TPA: hypothetical protein VGR46_00735 [Candidatus Limnocylindria bacterium]|nr:hypothetical protein [Candidatus Limnocylindria bacterium]
MAISDKDREAVLEVLRNAQFVYGLGRYPKKQVLDDPADVKALRERLEAMRAAAKGLSPAEREKLDVPWADLEAIDSGIEAVWKAAKRATPKIIAELSPLVRDEPEAAFLIAPIKGGRKAEIEPHEKVKERPKEKAAAESGLTGKEIAGLELVIQQRIAADVFRVAPRQSQPASLGVAEASSGHGKSPPEALYVERLFKAHSLNRS